MAAITFDFEGNLTGLRRDANQAVQIFKQTAAEANKAARGSGFGGAGGVHSRFEEALIAPFRRSRSARAERAIGGFVTNLATGNVGTAIASLATKMTGIGLAAGIVGDAVVGVFSKMHAQIAAADAAAEKLRENLARPISIQAGLSAEGIGKEMGATATLAADVHEKRQGVFQKFREMWQRGEARTAASGMGTDLREASQEPQSELEKEEIAGMARQRVQSAMQAKKQLAEALIESRTGNRAGDLAKINEEEKSKIAELRLDKDLPDQDYMRRSQAIQVEAKGKRDKINAEYDKKARAARLQYLAEQDVSRKGEREMAAKQLGLGSSEAGELAAARNAAEEKKDALRKQFREHPENAANILRGWTAANQESGISQAEIRKKFQFEGEDQFLKGRAIDRETSGMLPEEQKRADIRDKIATLQARMPQLTKEQQASTGLEIKGLQTDEMKEAFAHRNDPGEALWTPERGKAAKLANFVKDQAQTQEGLKQYQKYRSGHGSMLDIGPIDTRQDPFSYETAGVKDKDRSHQSFKEGLEYETPTFSSNLGGIHEKMGVFGGSDSFNKVFHKAGADPTGGAIKPQETKADATTAKLDGVVDKWGKVADELHDALKSK